ncbi:MAG: hypothetical protein GF383_16275 [Candidatus Lokiarchaeota archaeon]|nr:hypothetical protein [Candidatus Lokiarchaeota archaeon]MBD3343317.1 hypothetical protein [Candidatus Lokiarchaeota archaeon]
MNLENKFLGGIIGSALGDCIGEIAFYTNSEKDLLNIIESKSLITYTDDTAMAIGMAESIIDNKGEINSQALGEIFRKNYNQEPYRGYAMGPPSIFRQVEETGHSYVKIAQGLFGGTGSYGNGASMRIAPLGLFFHDDPNIYEQAEKSAIVTHAHPLGIDGAAVLARGVGFLVDKNPDEYNIKKKMSNYLKILRDYAKTNVFKDTLTKLANLIEEERNLDYCAYKLGANVLAQESVPFSLCAFLMNPYSFEKCLLETVLASSDRDTIGAMVGGLLGSFLGIDAIPKKWINKLENKDYIKELSIQLVRLKEIIEF